VDGVGVLFKLDYFDRNLACHSPDASDPTGTQRVLTVMLAEEYRGPAIEIGFGAASGRAEPPQPDGSTRA
jgi:hypothetical protein